MFYYAQINDNYEVINIHNLEQASTNENYIEITEEQYTSGDLVGKFYNSLSGTFEIMTDSMGTTDNVQVDWTEMMLSTKLDNMQVEINSKADINHTHDGYATVDHAHTGYVSSDDLQVLEDVVDTKADAAHTHSEYSPLAHSHNEYVLQSSFDSTIETLENEIDSKSDVGHTHSEYVTTTTFGTLESEVDGKAEIGHSHGNYSEITHNHDSDYSPLSHSHTASEIGAATSGHSHDSDYADINHNHDSAYADIGHDHNEDYSAIDHTHSDYATISALDELSATVSGKANTSHTHDDRYYTETEINNKLADKADSDHTHTGVYDVNGAAASALSSANAYTDNEIDALSEIVATKADAVTLSSHTGNTAVHITSTERTKLSGIDEGANNYTLPSAGTSLGGVKSGGDVTISGGVITVNDDSHNHVISNVDGLQSALDGKAASGHNHDGVYYTETEVDTLLEGKANSSHTHTISNITNLQSTLDGKASTSHGTHVSYSTTAPVMDGAASVGTASTVARSDHKHPTDTSRAAQTSLDSHTSNKSNPHGVTLAQLGVTATATELNKMDGVTATTEELNYVDGVTSNIQTQLNNKAASSHTHSAATTSAAGLMSASDKSKLDGIASGANKYTLPTASSSTLGGVKTTSTVTSNSGYTACPIISGVPYYKDTNTTYNLGSFGVTATAAELNALDGITATTTELNYVDGVTSNIQTQLNGKASSSHTHNYAGSSSAGGVATSANKLATARTISLTGDVTGSTSFDGSGNVSITATVADDSHNHTIANVDNLQTTLDGKASTSHTHSADALIAMAEALFGTNSAGGVEYSYGSDSGKNVLTEISNMPQGFHTIYSIAGTTGNPETAESYRYLIHKTSTTIGWIYAFGADGSIYSNYLAGANTYKGWKTIHDAKRKPLWTGSYYMTAGHTATPSKKLSECEHGWMLLWSDYDPDTNTVNNTDFCTTMIPNRSWAGGTWNGASFYCDIPRYSAGTATDSESRIIKILDVYDNKLVGNANNNAAPRNDVILRAVYEF